jgi:hypothetical protein
VAACSLRVAVVAALAALAGCGGGERAEPAPPEVVTVLQDDAELLHREPGRIAATLDDLRALGVDWVRITAGWSVIAPRPGGPRAWEALDRAVAMAQERGLGVNLDIAFFLPEWVRGRPDLAARYGDFAAEVAARYPSAAAFTVWNEPNHPTFLPGQWRRSGGRWIPRSPHVYRAMLQAAVPRIREAAPGALVLIGATSSLGEEHGSAEDDRMSPLRFVRELACVDARLRPLERRECATFAPVPGDGFSHHPYSGELPPWERDPSAGTARMADLDRLRALLDELHAAGRLEEPLPLYLTEYGYQSNPPDPTWAISPAEQARWLAEAERIARAEPTVRSVAQFLYRDLPPQPDGPPAERWRSFQMGLRFLDGRPKPARAAFALPLVAHRAGPGRVLLWGLVRPGEGEREATVEVDDGRGWRELLALTTRADGTFERTVAADPAARFRLVAAGRAGAPVDGAR